MDTLDEFALVVMKAQVERGRFDPVACWTAAERMMVERAKRMPEPEAEPLTFPLLGELNTTEVNDAFMEWAVLRSRTKSKVTQMSANRAVNKVAKLAGKDAAKAVEIIKQATSKGATGFEKVKA
jgi:hypothetical protein